jgi:DNA-binding MarR family transcriptional regulator
MPGRDHVQHVLDQWRREFPELDRSPFGVVGRISRLAQLLQAQIEPVFVRHGLNGGEFDVLAALRRAGSPYRLSPTELSTALIVSSGGMTKRLNALEDRGLIRRRPDPHDGRSTTVSLTRQGKRLAETTLRQHAANERRLLSGLSARQRGELQRLLAALAVTLDDDAAPTPPGTQSARRTPARRRPAVRR